MEKPYLKIYKWSPIKGLPDDFSNILPLGFEKSMENWLEIRNQLSLTPELENEIMTKLSREWSIETGNVEGIYKIDRGITETLIKEGISSNIICHVDHDLSPEEKVMVLNDHMNVVDGIFDYILSNREISTSYIKELHVQLCAHQYTTTGLNTFGELVEFKLQKGKYKTMPNNPTTLNGLIHEYCPPEQIDNEMENLVNMNQVIEKKKVPAIIQAAWLHHRFTQIHPFQDGNGRVARALALIVLLKANLLHFIVNNETRTEYLDALAVADNGDLKPLVKFIFDSIYESFIKADLYSSQYKIKNTADTRSTRLEQYKVALHETKKIKEYLLKTIKVFINEIGQTFKNTDIKLYQTSRNELDTKTYKQVSLQKMLVMQYENKSLMQEDPIKHERFNKLVNISKSFNCKHLDSLSIIAEFDKEFELIVIFADSYINDDPMIQVFFIIRENTVNYRILKDLTLAIKDESSIKQFKNNLVIAQTEFLKELNKAISLT